jgi:CheY-like chemotaxis protein
MAHVLVIEDEEDAREFVTRFLRRSGHRVTSAPDGREGLRLLLTINPDVVVTDVRMPGLDGIGLLEVMRSYLRWHDAPVILLSAHATPEQLDRARDLGVTRTFHKANFSLPELAAAIDDATGTPTI